VKPGYVPKRGDLIWLDFNPQAGHEQAGRRPALVISKDEYNRKVGLLLACPVTRQKKG
jgi:mRNA interferase MazF